MNIKIKNKKILMMTLAITSTLILSGFVLVAAFSNEESVIDSVLFGVRTSRALDSDVEITRDYLNKDTSEIVGDDAVIMRNSQPGPGMLSVYDTPAFGGSCGGYTGSGCPTCGTTCNTCGSTCSAPTCGSTCNDGPTCSGYTCDVGYTCSGDTCIWPCGYTDIGYTCDWGCE